MITHKDKFGKFTPVFKRVCWIEDNVCKILLASGNVAICDEDRLHEIAKYNWYEKDSKWSYPRTRINKKTISLHRLLYPEFKNIDHINGNVFDNRSCNLREATNTQNRRNSKICSINTSGFIGVSFHTGKWQVNIKHKYIGIYSDPITAAHIYDEHAKKLYGEFAKLNFPEA